MAEAIVGQLGSSAGLRNRCAPDSAIESRLLLRQTHYVYRQAVLSNSHARHLRQQYEALEGDVRGGRGITLRHVRSTAEFRRDLGDLLGYPERAQQLYHDL